MYKRMVLLFMNAVLLVSLCGCSHENNEKPIYYVQADYPMYETLNELFNEATHVIYGCITDVSNEMLSYSIPPSESDKEPTTVYTLDIQHCYKGETSSNIFYIRQFGGENDEKIVIYPDEPRLTLGDKYVLFLGGNCVDENTAWLLNPHQSAYCVSNNEKFIDVGGKGFLLDFETLSMLETAEQES